MFSFFSDTFKLLAFIDPHLTSTILNRVLQNIKKAMTFNSYTSYDTRAPSAIYEPYTNAMGVPIASKHINILKIILQWYVNKSFIMGRWLVRCSHRLARARLMAATITPVIAQYGQLLQPAKIYHRQNKPHCVNRITRTITFVIRLHYPMRNYIVMLSSMHFHKLS